MRCVETGPEGEVDDCDGTVDAVGLSFEDKITQDRVLRGRPRV